MHAAGRHTGQRRALVELWNHVMMRYRRHRDGSLQPLARPNVDTGMGLERLLMILQGKRSVFECDVFEPWMSALRDLWPTSEQSLRLLSDHLRASIVVIGDGVRPSNTGRGYVLRRLIRRALTTMWREDPARTLADLPAGLVEKHAAAFRPGRPLSARTSLSARMSLSGRTSLSGRFRGCS